jgi:hypothetical protein
MCRSAQCAAVLPLPLPLLLLLLLLLLVLVLLQERPWLRCLVVTAGAGAAANDSTVLLRPFAAAAAIENVAAQLQRAHQPICCICEALWAKQRQQLRGALQPHLQPRL